MAQNESSLRRLRQTPFTSETDTSTTRIEMHLGREEATKERNECSGPHLMSCICNVGTSVSVQPCAQTPVRLVCYPAFLHATAPQDMAICHWLGLLINTAPALHDSSQHPHMHTFTHNSSDRWVKRWATSCVK